VPAEDEHVRPLLYEMSGDGDTDAAVSAANNGDLAFQSQHDASLRLRRGIVRGRRSRGAAAPVEAEVGLLAASAQCGSSHNRGAKSNRLNADVSHGGVAPAVREKWIEPRSQRWAKVTARAISMRDAVDGFGHGFRNAPRGAGLHI
jgi:imidazolonepropionase-like amidohydrolase